MIAKTHQEQNCNKSLEATITRLQIKRILQGRENKQWNNTKLKIRDGKNTFPLVIDSIQMNKKELALKKITTKSSYCV